MPNDDEGYTIIRLLMDGNEIGQIRVIPELPRSVGAVMQESIDRMVLRSFMQMPPNIIEEESFTRHEIYQGNEAYRYTEARDQFDMLEQDIAKLLSDTEHLDE